MKLLPLLLAGLMISLTLSGCFGGDDKKDDDEGDGMENGDGDGMTNNNTTEPVALSVAAVDTPPGTPPNVYRWDPASLSAPANSTLNLTITSSVGTTGNKLNHNLVIDFGSSSVDCTVLPPGATEYCEFTLDVAPGEYTYYCSVGNHRDLGMEGTLTVT